MTRWWERARCATHGAGRDVFFSERDAPVRHQSTLVYSERQAAAICAFCPVIVECLAEALGEPGLRIFDGEQSTSSPVVGFWGGTRAVERRGHTPDEAPELAGWAIRRAIAEGLAPEWLPDLLKEAG